ncbi:MAG: MarR family transcriptional regulator, partial [Eggerthellaceae bacterium]|nr:MarR family transcriptional regulator [Eggerthellaceae bacterium]
FETFTVLIAKINRSIRKIKNLEMAEYDLKSPHISCLYHLHSATQENEQITSSDLCARCEEDKATISRSLDYLEKQGYLAKRSADAKRYKSPLALTDAGVEVGREIARKVDRVLDEVSDCLTGEERSAFYRSLIAISDHLEATANRLENQTRS